MNRFFLKELLKWKDDTPRKPLIISGARQVGKSYVVRELFAKYFKNYLEVNFEAKAAYKNCFLPGDMDPHNILRRLELESGQRIEVSETLIFLDEAQLCPDSLLSLRYFYEKLPELHIIAAGSLIEFGLENISIPVGRVTLRHLSPLSFEEFLLNSNNELLLEELQNSDYQSPFNLTVHSKGLSLLRDYLAIGGMPAVVKSFLEDRNYLKAEELQEDLIQTYFRDFPKYIKKNSEYRYVETVFNHVPQIICKQFKYSQISREIKSNYLRHGISLLVKSNLFDYIFSSQNYPLSASYNPDRYKLLFVDVGLLQRASGLSLKQWMTDDSLQLINSGQIAEQFVGQEILANSGFRRDKLFFWEKHKDGSSAEIDYLIERNGNIYPIEVKAGSTGTLKSLQHYLSMNPNVPYGIRLGTGNIERSPWRITTIPAYAWGSFLRKEE